MADEKFDNDADVEKEWLIEGKEEEYDFCQILQEKDCNIITTQKSRRRRNMDKGSHLDSLARILTEAEAGISKEDAEKQVKVEHCINIKTLHDYEVSCSYGDMVFIICILKDYLKLIAEKEGHIWDYYRERFARLADKLSVQIGYDYEKQLEKCRKKLDSKEKQDDIGEEAMALAVKRSGKFKGKEEEHGK